jgi:hypothetical protein
MGHPITRPGPVLYVACEGHAGFWKRLKAAAITRGWNEETFPARFVLATGRPSLIRLNERSHTAAPNPEDVLAAVARSAALGCSPVAVAIDTVFRSIGAGNVNASDHMNAYLAALATITDNDLALVAVHHETKAGGTPAGSVALIGGADTIIATGNIEGGGHSWQVEAAKDDAVTEPRKFVLPVVPIGEDADGAPASSCVIEPVAGQVPKPTRKMTDRLTLFCNYFKDIMVDHGGPMVPMIGMPQVTGIDRQKLREIMAERGWFSEGSFSDGGKFTKAALSAENNALTSLKNRGILCFNRLVVWVP